MENLKEKIEGRNSYWDSGLEVIKCFSEKGDKTGEYYTINNPENGFHVHSLNKHEVKDIIKCYRFIMQGRPIRMRVGLLVRDKALKLTGVNVHYKK